jgi:hypothetical protein
MANLIRDEPREEPSGSSSMDGMLLSWLMLFMQVEEHDSSPVSSLMRCDIHVSGLGPSTFSCFGFGEVTDLDELKGGGSRPSGRMTLMQVEEPLRVLLLLRDRRGS